jgi:ABC-type iron transport system FetAB ATPase subunit
MKAAEQFALNQWLSDYPEDMTYDEIIAALKVENQWMVDDITVWYLVENNTTDQVAMFIEDTKDAFERATADQPIL